MMTIITRRSGMEPQHAAKKSRATDQILLGKNRWEFTDNSLIYLEIYSRDGEDVVLMETRLLKQIQEFLSVDGVAAHILANNSLIHDSAIFQLTQRCKQSICVLPGDFASNRRWQTDSSLLKLHIKLRSKSKINKNICRHNENTGGKKTCNGNAPGHHFCPSGGGKKKI